MINKIRLQSFIVILVLSFIVNQEPSAQESCPLPSVSLPEFSDAIAARDSGKTDEAIAQMEQALQKFSGSPAPYYILGNWYWESGQQEEAKEMWRLARTAAPG